VFISLQVFSQFQKLGNVTWMFPSPSWGIFSHVMHLDQSRASEDISWIIMTRIPWWLSHDPGFYNNITYDKLLLADLGI